MALAVFLVPLVFATANDTGQSDPDGAAAVIMLGLFFAALLFGCGAVTRSLARPRR